MAALKKADSLPSELSVETLLRGVLTLEQGQAKKVFASMQKGLENLLAQGEISSGVVKEFRKTKTEVFSQHKAGEEKKMNNQERRSQLSKLVTFQCSGAEFKVRVFHDQASCEALEKFSRVLEDIPAFLGVNFPNWEIAGEKIVKEIGGVVASFTTNYNDPLSVSWEKTLEFVRLFRNAYLERFLSVSPEEQAATPVEFTGGDWQTEEKAWELLAFVLTFDYGFTLAIRPQ